MSCQRCQSKRVAGVSAKCSDMCDVEIGDNSSDTYVPKDLGIGGGDYVQFDFCLDCGQLQGNFPLPPAQIEKDITNEQLMEFFDNHFVEGSSVYFDRQVINSAEEEFYRLGAFVRDYFEFNSNRTPTRKHPSPTNFAQMFRDRDADLSIR